jgi:hypothetical protein
MQHVVRISAALALVGGPAFAADSVEHASQAATYSVAGVAHLAASGIEAVGGIVAVPLGVAGGVSQVVGGIARVGGESLEAAGLDAEAAANQALTDSWGPLSVDDRVIVRPDPAPQVPYQAQKAARR